MLLTVIDFSFMPRLYLDGFSELLFVGDLFCAMNSFIKINAMIPKHCN